MKKGLLTILLFVFTSSLFANHIVAGFSSYTHVVDNLYEINFTLVSDFNTNGAPLDEIINIQIFSFNGVDYTYQDFATIPFTKISDFDHGVQQPIAEQLNLVELNYAEYSFSYELLESDVDYIFVYQRCCRSPLFANTLDPNNTGISLHCTITSEAQALQNSSIDFDLLPPVFAEVNVDQDFPINLINLDADSLSFQFSPPLIGGGNDGSTGSGDPTSCTGLQPEGPCFPPYATVPFSSELSFEMPFPNWLNQGMDAQTGDLMGTPQQLGQYSYGFSIDEFRNGELINSTNFDYMVIVADFTLSTNKIQESKLEVFGNPGRESFLIKLINSEEYKFEVYSLAGEKITHTSSTSNGFLEVNILGPSGVYFLKASSKNRSEILKLIKL